jgi:hypothetical protein
MSDRGERYLDSQEAVARRVMMRFLTGEPGTPLVDKSRGEDVILTDGVTQAEAELDADAASTERMSQLAAHIAGLEEG